MIRNIVFDMGNVLIRFDPAFFLDRSGVSDPDDHRLVLNELFRSAEWALMDSGLLTESTAEPLILSRIPDRLRDTVRHLLYHWSYPREMVPGMEDLVTRLKGNGYAIYLLSNASIAQHSYWPQYPVSRYFDGKLISCDVKVVKPSREIYQIFTEKFFLDPSECLFIDDSPANVAGAISCGWEGIVFHGDIKELEGKMKNKGIILD